MNVVGPLIQYNVIRTALEYCAIISVYEGNSICFHGDPHTCRPTTDIRTEPLSTSARCHCRVEIELFDGVAAEKRDSKMLVICAEQANDNRPM